jgi:hypothetical protein
MFPEGTEEDLEVFGVRMLFPSEISQFDFVHFLGTIPLLVNGSENGVFSNQ